MSMNVDTGYPKTCHRCGKEIKWLEVHLFMLIVMVNDETTRKRFCGTCCADPTMAVLFRDMLTLGVKSIELISIFT